MSSLTYHAEHLAWQQRVNQEKSRATKFFKTVGGFPSFDHSSLESRPIFPRATIDENPINYRALKHTLGYTFGGTKPIQHSLQNDYRHKAYSKSPEKLRKKIRDSVNEQNPYLRGLDQELADIKERCCSNKTATNRLAYIQQLEEKLINERRSRIKAENKLVN